MRHASALVVLTNQSTSQCEVFGYIGLVLLDQHRRAMPTHLIRGDGIFMPDPGPHRVVLNPGSTASTQVEWEAYPRTADPTTGCAASAYAQITPPDETTSKTVPARIAPCHGGDIAEAALVAGSTGR